MEITPLIVVVAPAPVAKVRVVEKVVDERTSPPRVVPPVLFRFRVHGFAVAASVTVPLKVSGEVPPMVWLFALIVTALGSVKAPLLFTVPLPLKIKALKVPVPRALLLPRTRVPPARVVPPL